MDARSLRHWFGLPAVLGGLLFAALGLGATLLEYDASQTAVYQVVPLLPLLLAAGSAGLAVYTRRDALAIIGLFVAIAASLAMAAGFGLMAWLDNDYGWSVMTLGMVAHPVGLLLFGVAAVRRRLLPRWPALPLVMGLLGGPAAILLEAIEELAGIPWQQQGDYGFVLWVIAVAGGWIALGWLLWSGQERRAAPIQAHAS